MNRFTLAAAAILAGACSLANAQQPAPEVPRHRCEPRPQMPGPRMMSDDSVR